MSLEKTLELPAELTDTKELLESLYPPIEEQHIGETNSSTVLISDKTKLLIRYRAILSDLSNNINRLVEHHYGITHEVCEKIYNIECDFDEELGKILGDIVSLKLLETNFKEM